MIFGNKGLANYMLMKNTLLSIGSISVWLFVIVSMGNAKTIEVGKHHTYQSISEAISKATQGDTIIVHSGLYKEGNINITKSLTLIGLDQPIIDGQKKYEPISIRAPGVTIQGFTIKNSGQSSMTDIAGIKIYNTRNIIIQDNILDDNFFGIYSQGSKSCLIKNNRLKAYGKAEHFIGNGIHAWKSDSLTIVDNEIIGHRDGIYLEFVTHTQVERNLSANNLRYGLHFMFSHDNGYYYNTFSANGAGVAVMYTKHVRMEHNIFEENWGDAAYGLLLKDITDSHIQHNTFVRNTTAIFMEGSNRVQVLENNFVNNGWAIKLMTSCTDNTVTRNNFIQNTFDMATNGGKMSNTFDGNYWEKYEGYDLDKDGKGDIPYRPVSLFSMIVEKYPAAMLLFRSFMVTLFDRSERIIPSLTPEDLKDDNPLMKAIAL